MYPLTSSFYRANLEKKISSRLQAEGTVGVNGVSSMMCDCVRLIWDKKPEMKGVPCRGKIPADMVVQNTLLISIAMTHTVLYFPACNQLGVMDLHLNFLFGEAKSAEEDYSLK